MSKTAALVVAAAWIGGAGLLAAPASRAGRPHPLPASQTAAKSRSQSDLDAFMQKVLARRDDNWKKLQQYILTEKDLVDVRGLGGLPIWGEKREYAWYLRDGFFVQSPVKVNGVTVSEEERRKYEANFLKNEKRRDERRAKADAEKGVPAPPAETPSVDTLIKQSREPSFISSAYFLRFKFEQGKYALAGREPFAGREVLKIEYYPARLFSHEQDKQKRQVQAGKPTRDQDMETAIESAMNKVSLVTLWVDPKSFQIVKYTFDNVSLDFLPAAWLVRVNDLRASMVMSQPYPDIWLPHDIEFNAGAMLAVGQFDVRFRVDYTDYKLAETSFRIKVPKQPQGVQ